MKLLKELNDNPKVIGAIYFITGLVVMIYGSHQSVDTMYTVGCVYMGAGTVLLHMELK